MKLHQAIQYIEAGGITDFDRRAGKLILRHSSLPREGVALTRSTHEALVRRGIIYMAGNVVRPRERWRAARLKPSERVILNEAARWSEDTPYRPLRPEEVAIAECLRDLGLFRKVGKNSYVIANI